MEVTEGLEFVNNDLSSQSHHIAKGKRTKRQRPASPCAVVATAAGITTSSSSSAASAADHLSGGGFVAAATADYGSVSSTNTVSVTTNYDSAEEEEDMANCLILLAQGGGGGDAHNNNQNQNSLTATTAVSAAKIGGTRRFAEISTSTATATAVAAAKIGFYVYECKTCNRTFPSFQALGGHRASHKKPKVVVTEVKKPSPSPATSPMVPPPPSPAMISSSQLIHNYEMEEASQNQMKNIAQISLQLGSNNKAKIHECSICGSEFTSGQALGGHMRRHRASTAAASIPTAAPAAVVEVKARNILSLDLNLPAPEEDLRESKFPFTAPKQKPLVLTSAPSLVDCHY